MTADKPSPLVPKLRFPEFRDAGEWSVERLGEKEISKFVKDKVSLDQLEKETYVSTANLLPDYGGVAAISKLPASGSFTRYRRADILLSNIRPYLKKVWMADGGGGTSNDVLVIRASSRVTGSFLAYQLRNDRFITYIMKGAKGVKMPRGDLTLMKGFPVLIPEKEEQQKIADCLGSLDDLIATEDRKLESLRQHKQGLMQQLFPQPGETQPLLRFTEFRDAPDWGQVALGTLLDRPPEYGANAAAVPFSEDLPAYIRITDIDDDGRFVPAPRVSIDIEPSDDQYLQPGDIVLARTGASVGKSYLYREKDGRLVFAGFLIRVRPNLDRLVPEFLSAYLSTWSYWDWVRLTSVRSGQPGINGSEYASMPLTMPTDAASLPEQRKIADCFAVLDEGIALQQQRLRELRCHKNGLLQQLFPTPRAT